MFANHVYPGEDALLFASFAVSVAQKNRSKPAESRRRFAEKSGKKIKPETEKGAGITLQFFPPPPARTHTPG